MKNIPHDVMLSGALLGIDHADHVAERINAAYPAERQSVIDGGVRRIEEILTSIDECLVHEGWKPNSIARFRKIVRRAFDERVAQLVMPAAGRA